MSSGTSYKFTNAGAIDWSGPIQAYVNTAYKGTSLEGKVTIYNNGIQKWEVPATGFYDFELAGAKGGDSTKQYASGVGGKGAKIIAKTFLEKGTLLNIVVGQKGKSTRGLGPNYGGGGGGGTFIYDNNNNLLFAAGGGGGSHQNTNGGPGQSGTKGQDGNIGGTGGPISGGANGSGGYTYQSYAGAGGAGWLSSGQDCTDGVTPGGKTKSSWTGGYETYANQTGSNMGTHGGYGGGGASHHGGGGGGGYSGGGGARNSQGAGGGGGSYAMPSATEVSILSGVNENHGYAYISFSVFPPTNPGAITGIVEEEVYLTHDDIEIGWGGSTDPEEGSITYEIEYTSDGSIWTSIFKDLTETTKIINLKNSNSDKSQIRVRAKSSTGAYSEYTYSPIFKTRRYLILIESKGSIKTYKNGIWNTIQGGNL